jgi:hypothetical protein
MYQATNIRPVTAAWTDIADTSANGTLTAELLDPVRFGIGTVVPSSTETHTDADGHATLYLFAGSAARYRITEPDGATTTRTIPEGSTAIDLTDLPEVPE